MTNKSKTGTGLALAGLAAAAAAGYYFYASENAKSNRKIAAAWAKNMKEDVMRQARKVQNIDKADMLKIIDNAAKAYTSAKNVDRKELLRAAKELKANWQQLASEVMPKAAKKAVKKATKKASRKRGA